MKSHIITNLINLIRKTNNQRKIDIYVTILNYIITTDYDDYESSEDSFEIL